MYRLLRLLRITFEVAAILLLTIVLAGTGFKVGNAAQWIADMQIIPAALAVSFPILIFWIAATLVFGRIYCSTLCPMGALMDLASRIRLWLNRKHHYNYTRPTNATRIVWLILFVGLIVIGATYLAVWLNPYEAYSAICHNLFHSVWAIAAGKTLIVTALGCIISTITLAIVTCAAWWRGRLLCNTVCPIGTTLGILSRYSALHMDIDTDLCTQCGKCRDVCKAECIDLTDHVVDQSRCVVCFNCVAACRDKAIRYTWQRKQLSFPMLQSTFPKTATGSCASCSRIDSPAQPTQIQSNRKSSSQQ